MKSRKSEKRKESATLSGIIRASLRYASVPYVILDGEHPQMHRYKNEWYGIRPPVSTHDFGDVSSCEVWRLQRGAWGGSGCHGASVASWGGSGCRALEDGSGKEGEPKASGAERAGNIDHTAVTVNNSKARHTRQARSDEFASIPYWRNCTFT